MRKAVVESTFDFKEILCRGEEDDVVLRERLEDFLTVMTDG